MSPWGLLPCCTGWPLTFWLKGFSCFCFLVARTQVCTTSPGWLYAHLSTYWVRLANYSLLGKSGLFSVFVNLCWDVAIHVSSQAAFTLPWHRPMNGQDTQFSGPQPKAFTPWPCAGNMWWPMSSRGKHVWSVSLAEQWLPWGKAAVWLKCFSLNH